MKKFVTLKPSNKRKITLALKGLLAPGCYGHEDISRISDHFREIADKIIADEITSHTKQKKS